MIGRKFTRLTVVSKAKPDKWGHLQYLCLCDCGRSKVFPTSALNSGNTKSCGCLFRDMDRSGENGPNYGRGENMRGDKHPNYKHGLCNTKAYGAYIGTMSRRGEKSQLADDFDFNKVITFYQKCVEMNEDGEEVYVVDHIRPLNNGGVIGQDNLQILPYHLNAEKWCKWPLTEEQKTRYAGVTFEQLEIGGASCCA